GARLKLDNIQLNSAGMERYLRERFAAHGVAPERLVIGLSTPVWPAFAEIDIALDPFPHNAGTTTFEALWMGVPVVSLADRPPVGRFGAAILPHVGLAELVA